MHCHSINLRFFNVSSRIFFGYVLGDILWWSSFERLERTFKSWLANSCCNSRTRGRCFSFLLEIFLRTCQTWLHDFFFGWPVAWIQAQPNLKFHISPIDYNVSSKVALILLECWHLRNFELRRIGKGKNVMKGSESNLLRYLDHKSVGYAAYAPR